MSTSPMHVAVDFADDISLVQRIVGSNYNMYMYLLVKELSFHFLIFHLAFFLLRTWMTHYL